MRAIHQFSRGVLWVLLILVSGCATSNRASSSVEDLRQAEIQKTLTKAAFQQTEPILRRLHPDQPIHTTQLDWPVYPINLGSKVGGILAVSPGWAGELSGGAIGAVSKFGALLAFKDDFIYGQHIYGYILESAIFIPRYSLQTKAKVISESEYESLNAKKLPDTGWIYDPNEKEKKMFFKDLRVEQAKEITALEGKHIGHGIGELVSLTEAAGTLYSQERYQGIAEKLSNLPAGTDVFTAIEKLDGTIVANRGGAQFTFFINGFLNYRGQYRLFRMTPNGVYQVWPFGYVENSQEIPKLALVFKNGVVDKIIPYSSREQVEASLK